jgi:RNA polymerase sigma-70 factor (ECF subfamily)
MTGQAMAMAAAETPAEDVSERLGVLFDTHHQRLYRLARRLAGSAEDARDLVQETFLRASRAPGDIPEGRSNEEAWLVRVLINIARDRWRRKAVRKRWIGYDHPNGVAAADPEQAAIARATVWRALEMLVPRRRAILVMYELEGMTIPAIARLLGVAPVTVRWHLSRGRRELARALGAAAGKARTTR